METTEGHNHTFPNGYRILAWFPSQPSLSLLGSFRFLLLRLICLVNSILHTDANTSSRIQICQVKTRTLQSWGAIWNNSFGSYALFLFPASYLGRWIETPAATSKPTNKTKLNHVKSSKCCRPSVNDMRACRAWAETSSAPSSKSTSRPDSVISLSHWDSTCATIFTAFLWQLSTQVLNLYHQLSQVPDAPVNLSGFGMPFNSDLSLYSTDLSTFLLIWSCWLIASVIAWFNCAWPWVNWAIICIIIWDMLGPLVCPCAGAGGVPGCWGGCCCWAILSRSSGALRPDSREPLEMRSKVMKVSLDFPDFQELECQPFPVGTRWARQSRTSSASTPTHSQLGIRTSALLPWTENLGS